MRAEVEKMLDLDNSDDILEQNAFDFLPNGEAFSATPKEVGKYKITEEIGCGGMGVVYLAQRTDGEFDQKVAIKLIKRGMDSEAILRRFRNERQILADLRHPNIARLLDGGINSEGTPFYAMEYIEGVPVDEYCQDKKINEKLALFREICSAVTYAHNHLVVHRDIKPSNILVEADGTPKLLDFGIAKVLSQTDDTGTATQFGIMTPAYASPEQIRGEKVSTASDVYSLGVVLYELLTGDKPYQTDGKSHVEVMNLICNSELSKPSSVITRSSHSKEKSFNKTAQKSAESERLAISLKGDLDNILLKALQKEPARRYQSVQEFSEDVRRHQVGLPVNARPDTFGYHFSKFVQRNRVPVIAAILIFLSLCAGITIAVWQRERAEQQRNLADNRFRQVRQLANNVVFKYHDAIAALPGATATRQMLITDALEYLDNLSTEAEGNTELERELAAAYLKLGDVQGKQYEANIGDTAGARKSYEKSVALLEAVTKAEPNNTAAKLELVKAYNALFANTMRFNDQGKFETLEKALNLTDQLIAAEPDNQQFQVQKAQFLIRKGDAGTSFQNSLETHLQALPVAEKLYLFDERNFEYAALLARVHQRLGTDYFRLGDVAAQNNADAKSLYAQALSYHEKSLLIMEKIYLADERNLSNRRRYSVSLINLAETAAKTGQRDMERMNLALALFKQTADEDAKNLEARLDVALIYSTRAQVFETLGETKQAIEECEKASDEASKVWKADADNRESLDLIVQSYKKLIELFEKTNQPDKAELYRQRLEELTKQN